MKKYKCNKCYEGCKISLERPPYYCPCGGGEANWQEVKEDPEQKQETALPDWCKVGEWVYLSNAKYYKIKKVDSYGIILNNGIVIKTDDIHAEAVSARLRPYNSEEMKALVGKVIEHCNARFLVTSVLYDDQGTNLPAIIRVDQNPISAHNLLNGYTLDGQPCGVLEHIEKGAWVE